MKICEYIKSDFERTFNICGIPFFRQSTDYITAEKKQVFFFGLITTQKVYKENDLEEKNIMFFDNSFLKVSEETYGKIYYLFGKAFHKTIYLDIFKKHYFEYFNKKHDDIYILNANSGETFLTLTYIINSLIEKNNSKNPLLVATKKYHIDLIKMICPEIPFIYIEKMKLPMQDNSFIIDNTRFFLLYSNLYFKKNENLVKEDSQKKAHYFKSITDFLAIDESLIKLKKIQISEDIRNSMLKKVAKTGLNRDKFVFLAPEALSCILYDENFWVDLINNLEKKGFDVFVNLTQKVTDLKNSNYKTCDLSFSEAFALASESKKIVSLRSGLTEVLLQTNVPVDVIYTKFRRRTGSYDMDIENIISGFSLKKLPYLNYDLINEINTVKTSKEDCLTHILDSLEN